MFSNILWAKTNNNLSDVIALFICGLRRPTTRFRLLLSIWTHSIVLFAVYR